MGNNHWKYKRNKAPEIAMLSLSEDKLSDTVDLICSLTKVERESKTLKDSNHRLQSNEKHLYLVYDNKTHFDDVASYNNAQTI